MEWWLANPTLKQGDGSLEWIAKFTKDFRLLLIGYPESGHSCIKGNGDLRTPKICYYGYTVKASKLLCEWNTYNRHR